MLLAAIGSLCVAWSGDPEQFTGLRHERLFGKLGLTEKQPPSASPVVTSHGRWFNMDWERNPAKLSSLILGVHPTLAAARDAAKRFARFMPVSPDYGQDVPTLGDERYLWGTPERGTLLFVRDNVLVCFNWEGRDEAVAIARRMDDVIQRDRAVAPRGQLAAVPEIVSADIPTSMPAGATVRVQPDVHGLPAGIAVWVTLTDVDGSSRGRSFRLGQTLDLGYPYGGAPSTEQYLLVVLTEENLVLSKPISITYTARE
jgi:hypothetical protein